MNYIVLVKQVPDIRNIPKEAWDWEKGTLKRGLLDNVLNELDKQALAFALKMRERQGGRIIALTMGPPFAEEVLRYALSIGADEAVLLTDRKLGGADTAATAYPLSQAIRKVEKEIFSGDRNYLIVSGMQSVDGDTAQVGPGIATRLGCSQLTLVDRIEEVNVSARTVKVRRKLEGRHEIVSAPLPAMIAVLREINQPRYPTVPMRLMAEDAEITLWDNAAMKIDEQLIGLKGSATQVRKIFSPERAKGEILGDESDQPDDVARLLIDKMMEKDILAPQ